MGHNKIQDLLSFISKKWLVEIILELQSGAKRFSELSEEINGISNKVLSDRIKELYQLNLIDKIVYSLIPLNVKYRLSNRGLGLTDLFNQIEKYTELLDIYKD